MRFAAKRTWPDRPKAWEHQGEADDIETFALAFATDRGLGRGTEFVVLDKDAEDATLDSFRVTGTDPYTLGSTDSHPAAASPSDQPGAMAGEPPPPLFAVSAFSFMFYMVKVAVFFLVVIGTLMWLARHYGLTPPP
jgi:hypothetical protein